MVKLLSVYFILLLILLRSVIAILIIPLYMAFLPFIYLFMNKIKEKNRYKLFLILKWLVYDDDV